MYSQGRIGHMFLWLWVLPCEDKCSNESRPGRSLEQRLSFLPKFYLYASYHFEPAEVSQALAQFAADIPSQSLSLAYSPPCLKRRCLLDGHIRAEISGRQSRLTLADAVDHPGWYTPPQLPDIGEPTLESQEYLDSLPSL